MSRRGKRKDEDEYASDGDLDGSTHPKKAPRTDSDDSDTITICDISRNRRVSVRSWQGKVVVDIREFYMKDGRQMPGKKESIPVLLVVLILELAD
ncbi:RNA polymerase II transcriptional coactivator KIWI-like isoform X3 [Magnolia sinica]|uniref:RNA polymerase II transcriptional coactivator KIWI-like isoform X3 n=1 Tax=Magnolia sinica TaxID=86752 RepID=UPI00265B65DC|nr:RNA polymerase II transcriptional coactivator KIWI-like isoform X3 [Magnolia sinica]